uniref:Putative secreted protein n=1 Tax=Anopheles triannulatus TaxID=58253 RepID=A0A2M4AG50_9DIPT
MTTSCARMRRWLSLFLSLSLCCCSLSFSSSLFVPERYSHTHDARTHARTHIHKHTRTHARTLDTRGMWGALFSTAFCGHDVSHARTLTGTHTHTHTGGRARTSTDGRHTHTRRKREGVCRRNTERKTLRWPRGRVVKILARRTTANSR